jgi:DNA-binding MarR family transcriptional regulator
MGDRPNQGEYGDVLSNRRRRLVLDQLQSHGSMTLRDLAEQIAVIDQQTELEALCEEAVEEVEVALHHVHAPKLADADYVKYDARQRLVGLTDRGRQLRIEVECDGARIESADGIAVDLCLETIGDLHDLIQQDDRFDVRMSYDEVVSTILADSLSAAKGTEGEETVR